MSILDVPHSAGSALLVTGAPGSGRTTLALEMAQRRVSGGLNADDILVISASRRAAARMRENLARRLETTSSQPLARSAAALAFSIVRAWALANEEPPPVLVSGPEQDTILEQLLAGHRAGEGAPPAWPDSLPDEALALTGFRAELRDLLMRAAEYGLSPEELSALGREHSYQPWIAGGQIYGEYLDVTAQRWSTPDAGTRFDVAGIVDSAANLLAGWHVAFAEQAPGAIAPPPRWKTVIVDDYQEATAATVRLLHVLQNAGSELLLFGDPDAAVQTFRGAQPALMARAAAQRASELGAFGARHEVLPSVWGQIPALRAATQLIAPIIGSVGLTEHRKAISRLEDVVTASGGDPAASVAIAKSPVQEIAHLAYELRRAHVVEGLPWRDMAVIVRSGSQVDQFRRGLMEYAVPVVDDSAEILLSAEPAVQPLLSALEYAATGEVDATTCVNLLQSPIGGLDAVQLRRLRRSIWIRLKQEGADHSVDDELVELIQQPVSISLPATIRRSVERISAMLVAARVAINKSNATAETVLWEAWNATRLARQWQDQALAGGAVGRQADQNLDALMALFAAAGRFVERMPGASITAFVNQVRSESLPADTLAARASATEGVAVLTPAAAAGSRWDFVCVAGVQADVWPDLRLRGTILGAQRLSELLTGRATGINQDYAAARRSVLHDEARSFLTAISRARSRLIVTAVEDPHAELVPSAFLQVLLDGGLERVEATGIGEGERVPVSLRELVAVLRRAALEDEESPRRQRAEELLAALAQHQIAGANPQQWIGTTRISTMEPLAKADELVYLSPSRLDAFITCPLRWALEQAGGTQPASLQQNIGVLVHELAAELPEGTKEELLEKLDEKWPSLGSPTGWVGMMRRAKVEESVQRLAQYLDSCRPAVAVEQRFELALGNARVVGSADRIERTEDDKLRVVDFKTGAPANTEDIPRHSQLGVYQLAIERGAFGAGERSAGAALVYVGGPNKNVKTMAQVSLSEDEEPDWVTERITQTAEEMSGAAFLARENPSCPRCPVKRSCPLQNEGSRVF
ncbi:MAG TPA: PD-(D/E)XK nuclease family protein [Actinomycetales bacterium]|nr:PD-(D/E)XK nuclease family protein [Actinomycetales bacterium]